MITCSCSAEIVEVDQVVEVIRGVHLYGLAPSPGRKSTLMTCAAGHRRLLDGRPATADDLERHRRISGRS